MDELMAFARLRPNEPSMSMDDLATLRTELFPTVAQPADREEGEVIELADRRPSGPRRGPRWVVAAAALVAAVGLGGPWVTVARDSDPTAPAQQPATSTPPSAPVEPAPAAAGDDPYRMPRFAFTEPGWTMTHASEGSFGNGRAVVFLSDAGLDGPWIELAVSPDGDGGGDLPEAQFGTITAHVSEFETGSLLFWTEPSGRPMQAYEWHTDAATVGELLPSTVAVDDIVTVDALPEGTRLADEAIADALGRHGSFVFTHTDGRTLEITLSGGGPRSMYGRTGGEDRETVTVGGEEWSLLDYAEQSEREQVQPVESLPDLTIAPSGDVVEPHGRYRADVLRGFRTWEFDGEPFTSREAFIETITGITVVDEETWAMSLPDGVDGAADQSATIAALLDGVPLPDGFDVAALSDGSTNDRYPLIARVSGAVTCAWLDQWFTGAETGNHELQANAAAALATSHRWPMLLEIADQGGWSDEVWIHADAVNGQGGVMTGAGPTAPTRTEANSSLSCNI